MLLPVVILDYSRTYTCLDDVVYIQRYMCRDREGYRCLSLSVFPSRGSVDLPDDTGEEQLEPLEVTQSDVLFTMGLGPTRDGISGGFVSPGPGKWWPTLWSHLLCCLPKTVFLWFPCSYLLCHALYLTQVQSSLDSCPRSFVWVVIFLIFSLIVVV